MTEEALKAAFGLGTIPAINWAVGFLKTTFPKLPARYYPSCALAMGVIFNLGLAYIFGFKLELAVIVGLVAGAGACANFQYGKYQEKKG